MDKIPIFIVGAGGHAKVVSEIVLLSQQWKIAAYIDEKMNLNNFLDRPVFKTFSEAQKTLPSINHAFIAIGDNNIRRKWHVLLKEREFNIPWLAHPTAWISDSATIQSGALICAKSIVAAFSVVGEGTILNCSSILDHDSRIGTFSHLSQGAIACGGSQIGSIVLIGPGSIIEKLAVVTDGAWVESLTTITTAHK